MSLLAQHIIVLSIVATCVSWVGWQGLQIFRGKRSKIGSCCAKGCPPAAGRGDAQQAPKIVYIPADSVFRNRKRP